MLLLSAVLTVAVAQVATGTVSGVVQTETGAPLPGARVLVFSQNIDILADAEGRFTLELPPGSHEVSVLAPGFESQSLALSIEAGQTATIQATLVPVPEDVGTIEVAGKRIVGGIAATIEERRESSAVTEVLGAEQMSRSGDSTAASALRRVTGLTLVDGKYVYVRGLGERYSATLLNGSTLPSPEPERRVVPLDLFPSALLDSVVIQKTFSPELPAEFGGGVIALRTRAIPEQFFANIALSGGWRVGTTLETGPAGASGPTDWLGYDGNFRDLPPALQAASDDSPLDEQDQFSADGYTSEELEAFGESIDASRWRLDSREIAPDAGLSVATGGSVPIGGARLGVLAALSWDQKWNLDDYDRSYYLLSGDNELELAHSYHFTTLQRRVGTGGMFGLGLSFNEDHEVTSTTLLIRSSVGESRVYEGFNRDAATDIRVTRFRWQERQLFFEQLTGTHHFPSAAGFTVDWRYALSIAANDEPDTREYRYDREGDTDDWYLSDRPDGNSILYSDLTDLNHDAGLDLALPVAKGKVQVGTNLVFRDRTADTRRFKFMNEGDLSYASEVTSLPAEQMFSPDYIGADGFQLEENTRETDNYRASQQLQAGYALLDMPIYKRLKVLGGVRMEHSLQEVTTYELFNPDSTPVVATLETTDWLPALTLTQAFGPRQDEQDVFLIRGGYGRTLSRPDFRELSPATYNEVTGGREVFGNPELVRATIDNVDLRWEWYPSAREWLSVGGFYKHFTNPIESIVVVSAQHSVSYDNAGSANNYGAELELRQNFEELRAPWFFISGNAAWIVSRVALDADSGIQTSDVRPLQGQSPYVINAWVGYENIDTAATLALVYNVSGRRIAEVGAVGAPDTYEDAVHRLDLVASAKVGAGFKLGVKAQNLLDWPSRLIEGDAVVEEVYDGQLFAATLSWGR